MNPKDREDIMKQWDAWRKYIADGGKASWPRDAFEALLDRFEIKTENKPSIPEMKYDPQYWNGWRLRHW